MPEPEIDLVAYVRVSTRRQGESGLGLEGQKAAVEAYRRQAGASLKATYVEVESGTRDDRPELARALAHARRNKATLVVAKLDRLSRNLAFLAAVMDSGVDFVACDNPVANRLTLHILAAVAENEAKAISDRTKAALQALKARGVKLGSARPGHWKGREAQRRAGLAKAVKASVRARTERAADACRDLLPDLTRHRQAGLSLAAIAEKLNAAGHNTPRGKAWGPMQVKRVLDRGGVR